jgi:hypothetical protein
MTERKVEEGEEIFMSKDNKEGTKAMRKNSAAYCEPQSCHINLRRCGNNDAGDEG